MKKSITLLASMFLLGSTIPAAATLVASAPSWEKGCYYQLAWGNQLIALDGAKPDSLVARILPQQPTKAAIDSTLWQITGKTVAGSLVYEFKNKATGALLALPKQANKMTLDPNGITSWTFTNGQIVGYFDDTKLLALALPANDLKTVETLDDATVFTVKAPQSDYRLKASELGAGIATFYMQMGESYVGDIFSGKELVAKEVAGDEEGYVTLQYKGDETFPNGKPKYLGVDTVRTQIDGAENVFGYNFKADSTYTVDGSHKYDNTTYQQFRFTIDLKNDSIAMFVKGAPEAIGENVLPDTRYRVVFATYDNIKRLTVARVENGEFQGTAPLITTSRGEAAKLANGSGVYFLKRAQKNNSKYLYTPSVSKEESPSDYLADGQWYIKEQDGKYSIVERKNGEIYAQNAEIFPVNGLQDTYTVAGKVDSLTFVYQKDIDIQNKYLGVKHMSEAEMQEKAVTLILNAVGGSAPVVLSNNTLVAQNDGREPVSLRVANAIEKVAGGAQAIGDTLYTVSYQLTDLAREKMMTRDNSQPSKYIMSANASERTAVNVTFAKTAESDVYHLLVDNGQAISYDVKGNLIESESSANFIVDLVDAPEYISVESTHIRLESNGKYLTMNPYTLLAEMKSEGQQITKATTYTMDDFALKIEKADTTIAGKPVYMISTRMFNDASESVRYYLTALDTVSTPGAEVKYGFMKVATTKSIHDLKPGYFAFKLCTDDEGYEDYILENVRTNGVLASKNNVLLESTEGLHLNIEKASAPTAVETITTTIEPTFQVAGGYNTIIIMNAKDRNVVITDILGKIVGNYKITSDRFTVQASRGIHLVAVEGEIAQKVIVK